MGITDMKGNRFFYLLREGLRGVFSHGFRSFASVTVIVACLIIMGSFALVSVNVDSIIADMERESEILAFVDDFLTEEEARSLEKTVRDVSNVREVQFVTREVAMENYKATYEDDSLFQDIDSSVFRHRYVIYLDDITLMQKTKADLESINGIDEVNAPVEIADAFFAVRNVVSIISVVLVIILMIVSLFIMANTIKLATFTRREEIAIMKMVGASNTFIRVPFIIEGLILGILGGGIGFLLEWGVYNVLSEKVMETMAGNLFNIVPFSALMTPLLIVYLAVGVLVGAFGGALAIRNYLKV